MSQLKKAENTLLFIIDKRMPEQAKYNLCNFGDILELTTEGITYNAISGHPDIFFCNTNKYLIAAPNVPESYINTLRKKKIKYITGKNPVRNSYPESAIYNAVTCNELLIHRFDITDKTILDSHNYNKISVTQGYTRCNLLPLKNNSFITSDAGIYKNLKNRQFNIIYVNPEGIILGGFRHGFFGGACGVFGNTVFIAGKLDFFPEGKTVTEFLRSLKYDLIELYDGPLFDCGSILAIE